MAIAVIFAPFVAATIATVRERYVVQATVKGTFLWDWEDYQCVQ